MQNTIVGPGTKTDDERFRPSARSARARENQHWPVQADDKRRAWLQRTRTLSNGPKERPSTLDYAVRRPTALEQFFASYSLERSFTLLSFIVAVCVFFVFGFDLACGWPFRRASLLFDATSTICGAALLFLCWDVFREQAKGLIR
jgi:hypothetical protein